MLGCRFKEHSGQGILSRTVQDINALLGCSTCASCRFLRSANSIKTGRLEGDAAEPSLSRAAMNPNSNSIFGHDYAHLTRIPIDRFSTPQPSRASNLQTHQHPTSPGPFEAYLGGIKSVLQVNTTIFALDQIHDATHSYQHHRGLASPSRSHNFPKVADGRHARWL